MLNVSVSEITRPKDIEISSDEVIDAIRHKAGPLAQLKLDYEPQIKTLWVTLAPEPKPVFTLGLVDSLFRLQKAVVALWGKESYARSPIRFFVYRSKGPIFTLGGDLDFYLDCIARVIGLVCWSTPGSRLKTSSVMLQAFPAPPSRW